MLNREENNIWKRNFWSKWCGGGGGGGADDDDRYDVLNGDESKLLETEIILKYIDRRGMAMKGTLMHW